MHRIIEVAHMLGVSKVTIYKKISSLKNEIKPYLIKDKNVTFLTDDGVEIIKESLKHLPLVPSQISLENGVTKQGIHTMTREAYQLEQNNKEELLKEHFNDLVMTYDYLKSVKKNKQDRLKSLKTAIDSIRFSSNEIKKQIELIDTKFQSSSK